MRTSDRKKRQHLVVSIKYIIVKIWENKVDINSPISPHFNSTNVITFKTTIEEADIKLAIAYLVLFQVLIQIGEVPQHIPVISHNIIKNSND